MMNEDNESRFNKSKKKRMIVYSLKVLSKYINLECIDEYTSNIYIDHTIYSQKII